MFNLFHDYDFAEYYEKLIKGFDLTKTKLVAVAPLNNYQMMSEKIFPLCEKYNIPIVSTKFINRALHASLINDEYPYRPTDEEHHELADLILKALK